jgi:asparagine synthase (glutamine-hydrolysing)
MCGIIGINENNKDLIKKASKSFAYRGPDAYFDYADSFVALGHHRLSIIDTNVRSNQPFWDSKKEIGIVYNGEIYNFKELRNQLSVKYDFRTNSDTEVLIYAYKEWGIRMSEYIQGMFAFAIYDKNQKKILLMRDHRGIKPLYYYAENGMLIFSSEIKGVIKALKEKKINTESNKGAIDLYLTMGYVPSPYTLYGDIFKLPRASYLEYDLEKNKIISKGKYPIAYRKVTDFSEYVSLIEQKILSHLIADVPVGVFFSGGTDSSLITAILHKNNINLETFSIGIDYKSEDANYFKKISEHLKLKSNTYSFDKEEFDRVYEEVMSKMDEPSYDNSIFPTYFVSKKAAEKVKVVLSGEGGDEFFYGYPRSLILSKLNDKRDYYMTLLDYLFFITPSFRLKNFIFEKLFIFFKKPVSFYILHMSPARDRATFRSWKKIKEEFKKRNIKPVEFDQEFYLENDLLRKTDFATSYVSIEGRVPLLDIEIIENSKNFEEQKLEGGMLKSFLKKILALYLPKDLVYRSKSGFGLDMIKLFQESALLKSDLVRAINFLKKRKLLNVSTIKIDGLMKRYPHYCFALISLYRSILNNERI